MSGYVPLFDSIATGTLYGRWPDIGLWPIILALADRRGHLDVSPGYLSGVTGLPEVDVIACMKRFCAADPASRSKEEGGARLVCIDPNRDWGWIVVNHGKYREKARLMAKDSARTASGKDAERKKEARCPPMSPALPPSYSDSNADSKSKKREEKIKTVAVASVDGLNLEAWQQWLEYRKDSKKPIKAPSIREAMLELAAFGDLQVSIVKKCIASGYQGLYASKSNGRQSITPGGKWE